MPPTRPTASSPPPVGSASRQPPCSRWSWGGGREGRREGGGGVRRVGVGRGSSWGVLLYTRFSWTSSVGRPRRPRRPEAGRAAAATLVTGKAMHKVWAVIRREFVERVRTKWFWVSAVLGPVLFAGIIVFQIMQS